jgi:predicted nucleotide-binding protein
MSQVVRISKSVNTVQVNNKCGTCKKNRARKLVCGHVYHVKCLKNKCCNKCGVEATTSVKIQNNTFDNATQRMTTGSNGNAYITINQQDEWGRTTITREIKKNKLQDYMTTIKNNKDNNVNGKTNLGLVFMSSLMGNMSIKESTSVGLLN